MDFGGSGTKREVLIRRSLSRTAAKASAWGNSLLQSLKCSSMRSNSPVFSALFYFAPIPLYEPGLGVKDVTPQRALVQKHVQEVEASERDK